MRRMPGRVRRRSPCPCPLLAAVQVGPDGRGQSRTGGVTRQTAGALARGRPRCHTPRMLDDRASSETPLRIGPLALAIILAFTLSSALGINPYCYGLGDNRITIPFLKAFVDPSLYPGDPLLAERPFYYTYLWNTLGALHAHLGLDLPFLFLGTYLVFLYLTFLALYLIALALFRNRASATLSLVFLAFSHVTLGGIPTTDQMLTTRVVATPIALLALLAFLRGRTVGAFALLGLAYLVHPITTHVVLAILVVASVLVRRPGLPGRLAAGLLAS